MMGDGTLILSPGMSYEEIHRDTLERKDRIIREFRLASLRGCDPSCDNRMTIFDLYVQPLRERKVMMGLEP